MINYNRLGEEIKKDFVNFWSEIRFWQQFMALGATNAVTKIKETA